MTHARSPNALQGSEQAQARRTFGGHGLDYTWTARVRWLGDAQSTVYARNNAFTVGRPASFRDKDPHPSAVEYLLGALGADLTAGFYLHAGRRGVQVDAMELSLTGRLENALVYAGVIGAEGEPTFREFTGTFFVSSDVAEDVLQALWATTLQTSPTLNTLKHAATISIELRVV